MIVHNNFIIRKATMDDVVACVNSFSLLLLEIEDFPENDLISCQDNVSLFNKLVIQSINEGFPPIVSYDINGKFAGCSLIIKLFGFITKESMAQALGSYVYPEYRSQGLSTKMLEYGFEVYESLGVKKILGKVLNQSQSENINKLHNFNQITVSCKTLSQKNT